MSNRYEVAISRLGTEPHWPPLSEIAAVSIVENGEPLVPLSLVPEKILVRSAYYEAGIAGSKPECYAREKVFEKLLYAADLLPSNLRLVVLDGWRSPVVQRDLFKRCCAVTRSLHPDATDDEIHALAQEYVALPSVAAAAPSPHLTGGAIDVTLATRDGRMLSFGSIFDYPAPISYARAFEDLLEERGGDMGKLAEQERQALENRRLLCSVMVEAGFCNYSYEWWHFEFGTQRWAVCQGQNQAMYGPTKLSFGPFVDFFDV